MRSFGNSLFVKCENSLKTALLTHKTGLMRFFERGKQADSAKNRADAPKQAVRARKCAKQELLGGCRDRTACYQPVWISEQAVNRLLCVFARLLGLERSCLGWSGAVSFSTRARRARALRARPRGRGSSGPRVDRASGAYGAADNNIGCKSKGAAELRSHRERGLRAAGGLRRSICNRKLN